MRRPRLLASVAIAAAVGLVLAGCSSDRDKTTSSTSDTLIFGAAGDAKVLDPALASDGETFRVTRQLYDTLVQPKIGGSEIEPALATSWEADDSGKVWTFHLREGVKFSDGTDFDGAAVCYNFDRWYNWTGLLQNGDVSLYWQSFFGGFSDGAADSLYASCSAPDASTAVITTTRVTSGFPAALSLSAFSIASPTALAKYNADDLTGSADNITYPDYATGHPVGTGPYVFDSWDHVNQTITLVANPDYWGGAPKIKKLIFRTISDLNARKTALRAGEIQGYDLVAPEDVDVLASEGFNILTRPAFNVLYLGINQKGNPALADIRVRQAIAYAINRQAIVDTVYPQGATVAKEFLPPTVPGYSDSVTEYAYDKDKAKALLADAGYATGLTLRFIWPAEVTRPYMPAPQDIFELIKADLEAVGITVQPDSKVWNPDYLNAVQEGSDHDLHLLGWTGDYGDAYNFIGTFFAHETDEWGFDNPEIFDGLAAADLETDATTRYADYQDINNTLMDYLPGVPIAHSPNSLVVAGNVAGLTPSPLSDERFFTVYYNS